MALTIQLGEVLSPDMIDTHQEHIRDFLTQEGIPPAPDDLGATEMTERQLKELVAELAHDTER